MKTVKEKIIKLKNRYNNDIVYTKNYNDVVVEKGMTFIRVFDERNPERIYLVNKDAFLILDK